MTRHIAATELKAKLAEILGDVERGETIEITRHGKTVAHLVPTEARRKADVREAIDELEKLRSSLPKTGITIDDILKWRHEGHRY